MRRRRMTAASGRSATTAFRPAILDCIMRKTGASIIFALIGTAFWSPAATSAPAATNVCSAAQAIAAEEAADTLADWPAVAAAYDQFRQCDDGAIAEGYTDSVGRLLGRDQPEAHALAKALRTRPGMLRFLLRHVNETLPEDELTVIAEKLPTRCGKGEQKICKALSDAAKQALIAP